MVPVGAGVECGQSWWRRRSWRRHGRSRWRLLRRSDGRWIGLAFGPLMLYRKDARA